MKRMWNIFEVCDNIKSRQNTYGVIAKGGCYFERNQFV